MKLSFEHTQDRAITHAIERLYALTLSIFPGDFELPLVLNDYEHGTYQIPKEEYLSRRLSTFLSHVRNSSQVIVRGYQGDRPLTDDALLSPSQRHQDWINLNRLPTFDFDLVPNMNNGHISIFNNRIERCLVLELPHHRIKAAIYFHIELDTKNCFIHSLGVDQEYNGQHLGSIVFHSALFIAMHYQCRSFQLQSTNEGRSFYLNQGFSIHNDQFILNLDNQISRNILLSKMHLTCPFFTQDMLLRLLQGPTPSQTHIIWRGAAYKRSNSQMMDKKPTSDLGIQLTLS